jgi:hypothetical protein
LVPAFMVAALRLNPRRLLLLLSCSMPLPHQPVRLDIIARLTYRVLGKHRHAAGWTSVDCPSTRDKAFGQGLLQAAMATGVWYYSIPHEMDPFEIHHRPLHTCLLQVFTSMLPSYRQLALQHLCKVIYLIPIHERSPYSTLSACNLPSVVSTVGAG